MPKATYDDIFVSTQWLAQRLDAPDVVVIDGSYYLSTMNRDASSEYIAGHIPGAIRFDIDTIKDTSAALPHMMPSPSMFAKSVGALGIGDGMTLIVYDGMGLFSAPRVRWMFKAFGAKNVMILDGGFPKWQSESHPVNQGLEPPRRAASFTPRFDASTVADLKDIRTALTSGSAQVVDARPSNRFKGKAPEPRAGLASGHMPGSRNLPFGDIISNGRMVDADAIKAAFAEAGLDLSKPIITSCGSGVSAAILSTALELVGQPAKSLYDASWAEWGGRDDCVVETGPAK